MARVSEKITVAFLTSRINKVRDGQKKIAAVRAAADTVKDEDAKKLVLSSVSDLAILVVNARKKVIGEVFERLSERGSPEQLEKLVTTFADLLDPAENISK